MGPQNVSRIRLPRYGRLLDDFIVGEVYYHPWEVTIDEGMLAIFAASFLDPNPLYTSRPYARELGFRDRVIHPLVLMNLALSFSVHDVSEQVIAHLAYIDLTFPNAAHPGDTLTVSSTVLGVRPSESKPDRGVVHVRTVGINQDGLPVVSFERKALARAGKLAGRAHPQQTEAVPTVGEASDRAAPNQAVAIPSTLLRGVELPRRPGRPQAWFEDFEEGEIIFHDLGRTVGESEHMQLTVLTRNSHPIHFDEIYCREHSFARTRVVEGGLVFAWVASLASRDTTANALWEVGYDNGSHPAPVIAGDTLYAASRVCGKRDFNERAGIVKFDLIGTKNKRPASLNEAGFDLFEGKPEQKVFQIERSVLLPKLRPHPTVD
jgi:2-methylfumaryl-CoA hydratase